MLKKTSSSFRLKEDKKYPSSLLFGAASSVLAMAICSLTDETFFCSPEFEKIHLSPTQVDFTSDSLNYKRVVSNLFFSRIGLTKRGIKLPDKYIDIVENGQSIRISLIPYTSNIFYNSLLSVMNTLSPVRILEVPYKVFTSFRSSLLYEKNFRVAEEKLIGDLSGPLHKNLPFIALDYDRAYKTVLIFHKYNKPSEVQNLSKVFFNPTPPKPEPEPKQEEDISWLYSATQANPT